MAGTSPSRPTKRSVRGSGKRHTVDMNKLLPVAYGVIMLLVFISVSALWLDIVHPFKLG